MALAIRSAGVVGLSGLWVWQYHLPLFPIVPLLSQPPMKAQASFDRVALGGAGGVSEPPAVTPAVGGRSFFSGDGDGDGDGEWCFNWRRKRYIHRESVNSDRPETRCSQRRQSMGGITANRVECIGAVSGTNGIVHTADGGGQSHLCQSTSRDIYHWSR